MKTKQETINSLNLIRKTVDEDIIDSDIEMVKNKMLALTQLIGLSSEANASAKKLLHQKELQVLSQIDKALPPSIQNNTLKAECFEEIALLEYADRLNSGIIHNIDALRSVMSLHKVEIENSLKQS